MYALSLLTAPVQQPAAALQPAGTWARVGAYSAGTASVLLGVAAGLALTGPLRFGS